VSDEIETLVDSFRSEVESAALDGSSHGIPTAALDAARAAVLAHVASLRARAEEAERERDEARRARRSENYASSLAAAEDRAEAAEARLAACETTGSRVRKRLVEVTDVLDAVQALPPERITSREYGWMRDAIASARAALASSPGSATEGSDHE